MTIRSVAQLRALYSPTRQEVLDALEAAGPLSVRELASLLVRQPTGLYVHVQVLERVGLIVATGTRREERHVAKVYDASRRPNLLEYDGPAGRRPIVKIISAAIRLSQREFSRACTRGAKAKGPERLLWGGRARGWLTRAEIGRVNRLIGEAQELLRGGRPRKGARAMTLGFVLSPVDAQKTRRKAGRG